MQQPKSATKDLRELQCLVQRNPYLFWDSAPFIIGYILLLSLVAQEGISSKRYAPHFLLFIFAKAVMADAEQIGAFSLSSLVNRSCTKQQKSLFSEHLIDVSMHVKF